MVRFRESVFQTVRFHVNQFSVLLFLVEAHDLDLGINFQTDTTSVNTEWW